MKEEKRTRIHDLLEEAKKGEWKGSEKNLLRKMIENINIADPESGITPNQRLFLIVIVVLILVGGMALLRYGGIL